MAERQIDSPIILFIDNLDDKIEYTVSKFVDHNKLEESQIQHKEEPHTERPQYAGRLSQQEPRVS